MVEAVPGRTREQCSYGILGCWVPERSGAPNKYPYQTCHRGFPQWVRSGKLERILRELAGKLRVRGTPDLEEAPHRCLLHRSKKKGFAVGPTQRGKGTKILVLADAGEWNDFSVGCIIFVGL